MPKAQRMAQMLTVAEEIFAEQGYLATSMDEIAERCGVSKPMLYEYFGSKEGLLIGCIHRARAELREKTAQAIAVPSAQEEVEGIRQQQTDMIGSVLVSFAPDIDPLEAEAFAEIVVGAWERLAVWCERRPSVGPALATDYVMAVIWPGVADRVTKPL